MADLTGAYTHLALIAIPMQVYGDFSGKAPFISVGQPGDRHIGPTYLDELPEYLRYLEQRSTVTIVDRIGQMHDQQQRLGPIDARIENERRIKANELELGRVQLERNLEFLDRMFPANTGDPVKDANNLAEREKRKDQARQVYERNVSEQMGEFEQKAGRRRTALYNLSYAQEQLEANRQRQEEIRKQREENLKKARKKLRRTRRK